MGPPRWHLASFPGAQDVHCIGTAGLHLHRPLHAKERLGDVGVQVPGHDLAGVEIESPDAQAGGLGQAVSGAGSVAALRTVDDGGVSPKRPVR